MVIDNGLDVIVKRQCERGLSGRSRFRFFTTKMGSF